MKPSKWDPWITFFSIAVFVYSFFIVGRTTVYWGEGEFASGIIHHSWEVKGIEYPAAVIICPILAFFFCSLYVFRQELLSVSIKESVKKAAGTVRRKLKRNH